MKLSNAILALTLSVLPQACFAAEAVNIEANEMEIIDSENKTIFRGNVIATRPKDQITSDEMIVTSSDKKQEDGTTKAVTELLDATGHVVITTKTQVITGTAAKFYIQKDKLEVTGNVWVTEGTNVIHGEKLKVDLKTNHLQMTGGRVQSSFTPK
jgi:lipopolysaccharide export system protein LptA